MNINMGMKYKLEKKGDLFTLTIGLWDSFANDFTVLPYFRAHLLKNESLQFLIK